MLTASDVQRSFHYLFPQELPILISLAQSLPPNPLIINIGAGAGTSGLAFLESRPDAVVVTIDIQDESSPFGCLEGERQVVEQAGYGSTKNLRWFQIHGDSKRVGKNWRISHEVIGGQIFMTNRPDLVFIDGDHSYEGAKGDIEIWMDNLKDGGILIVHDYLKGDLQPDPNGPHPQPWPDVDSAVNELLIPNFEMIVHVASLVAFRKKVE